MNPSKLIDTDTSAHLTVIEVSCGWHLELSLMPDDKLLLPDCRGGL
jgi:hypothetical protein